MYELLVLIAITVGMAVGTYYVAQSPVFWVGLIKHVAKEMAPVITKRMPKDVEAKWRDCERRGGKWNHHKQRCE